MVFTDIIYLEAKWDIGTWHLISPRPDIGVLSIFFLGFQRVKTMSQCPIIPEID